MLEGEGIPAYVHLYVHVHTPALKYMVWFLLSLPHLISMVLERVTTLPGAHIPHLHCLITGPACDTRSDMEPVPDLGKGRG